MHGSFPTPNITSTTSTQEVANPFSIDRLIAKQQDNFAVLLRVNE